MGTTRLTILPLSRRDASKSALRGGVIVGVRAHMDMASAAAVASSSSDAFDMSMPVRSATYCFFHGKRARKQNTQQNV